MNSNLACDAPRPEKSAIYRIVNSAHSQNVKQQAIEQRLGALLEQLRGTHPMAGGCGKQPDVVDGALPVLEDAITRHCELNNSILDQVAELESLLAF